MNYPLYDQISERVPASCRIGVFPVGLHKYWAQFPGLLGELDGYAREFCERIRSEYGVTVVSTGMIDSAQASIKAAHELVAADCDLLFCFVTTYAPAATVLPLVQLVGRPVVLVALQPEARLNYAQATQYRQLANDNCTSLPEIANGLIRAGRPQAGVIVGQLRSDSRAEAKLRDWVRIGCVLNGLRGAVIGQMGHTYEGMLDMNTDPTAIAGTFGCHVQMLEPEDLLVEIDSAPPEEVDAKVQDIEAFFEFPGAGTDPHAGAVTDEQLRYSAAVAVGLDRLIRRHDLRGLCYYYIGGSEGAVWQLIPGMIVGNSLLTGRGIPVAGECDLKTCIAMLVMDRLGTGGSFCEFHPIDFVEDFVLVGHDGPAHIAIADSKPILRGLSLLHGKEGQGASVEFGVRAGPITLCGLTSDASGRFKFVVAEGESLKGLVPATGNTNTRGKFGVGVASFVERWSMEGPTHHFAVGVGHHGSVLRQLAGVLGVDFVQVC